MSSLESLLNTLNTAPPKKQEMKQFFITGNNPTTVQQFTSRLSRSACPLPHDFSLNFVSGTVECLVFGQSESFAQQARKLIQSNQTGIIILDLSNLSSIEFSKQWVQASQKLEIQLWILVTGKYADQRQNQICETLLRALACSIRAGYGKFEIQQTNEVVQAILTSQNWSSNKSLALLPGQDQPNDILQNSRNAEDILEKMTSIYESEIKVKQKGVKNVNIQTIDEYLKYVDTIGKCGEDIELIINQIKQ
ncbi:hypothetical protein SS50377_23468 [Spironucleus salmonicida]|uniref:Uncharacterized protein n=1 Tax=Spironucleus salmonicida TaxID=348837 RepID=V6LR93_9EUKA|nr:hypothetical protein SS50377_28843 [Spironucleus salmonicida]KAH0573534.1 hypothetical protein SS50377_23468 [Spironucleus salmonicida]|eukprot:EST46206.1 Hypothetical protein SS50377_13801 [Spironucleus salmonicida]